MIRSTSISLWMIPLLFVAFAADLSAQQPPSYSRVSHPSRSAARASSRHAPVAPTRAIDPNSCATERAGHRSARNQIRNGTDRELCRTDTDNPQRDQLNGPGKRAALICRQRGDLIGNTGHVCAGQGVYCHGQI